MTKRKTFDELMDSRELSRIRAEERACDRMDRRERLEQRERAAIIADPRVGQLQRGTTTVFYVYPAGGKYREAVDALKLARYL